MEISKTQLIVAGVIIILVVAIVGFMWWEKSKKTKLDKNKIDAPTKRTYVATAAITSKYKLLVDGFEPNDAAKRAAGVTAWQLAIQFASQILSDPKYLAEVIRKWGELPEDEAIFAEVWNAIRDTVDRTPRETFNVIWLFRPKEIPPMVQPPLPPKDQPVKQVGQDGSVLPIMQERIVGSNKY